MRARRWVVAALTALLFGGAPASARPAVSTTGPPVVGAAAVGGAVPSTAVPADPRGHAGQPVYLSLGDSLAAGYQPGVGDDRDGGYAGPVLTALARSTSTIRLVNLACSGETTMSMLSGGLCYRDGETQLRRAEAVLADPANRVRLVTVSIGANDVQRCVSTAGIDVSCVSAGIAGVGTRLPQILDRLRAAAPRVRIVVLNYYNPFLAAWLAGGQGPVLALASRAIQEQLTTVIGRAARGVGARVANVETAFRSTDWAPRPAPGLGTVPDNVARICTLTWMCARTDIHPNDAGYQVVAASVLAQLRRR